jgi:hypothetical protein
MQDDRLKQPQSAKRPFEPPTARVIGTIVGLTQSKGGADTDTGKGIPVPGHLST